MRERFDNPKSVSRRQAVRRAAGLSLRQAAKIMNVDPEVLVAIETGQADPLHWFHLRMRETYGMDPEVV
jgi:DNA-binding XRE family transcriptional regulator